MRVDINAIGYRKEENLIYGIDPNLHFLYRVDSRGFVENLTRLPLHPDLSYFAADITPDGQYLILIGGTGTAFLGTDVELVKVDLTDPSYPVQRSALDGPATRIYDIAFHPLTGELFGFDSNNERLVIVDLDQSEVFANYASTPNVDNAGSLFFDAFGNLYAYGGGRFSQQNTFYKVDLETGEFIILARGPDAEGTDACSCPYTIQMTKTVLPEWSYPCEQVEYIFTIANASGTTQDGLYFSDGLPNGSTFVRIVDNPFGGDVLSNPGDDRFEIDNFSVPPGIDTLRILVEIGQVNSGFIYNQAQITGLPEALGETVISDDPRTLAEMDSTYLEIRRIATDSIETFGVICDDDRYAVDLSSLGRQFLWFDGETSPTREFEEGGIYEVLIVAGCDTAYMKYDIEEHDINVSLRDSVLSVKLGDTIALFPDIQNTGDSTFVVWLDPEGNEIQCGECSFYEFLPLKSGTYTIRVENEYGCTDIDLIRIEVDNTREVYIPNIFSPNGDNINDKFYIQGLGYGRIDNFYVFDRWGEMVYKASKIWINDESVGWNGNFNGKKALPGVYTWMAEVTFLDQRTEFFSGDVTLLR
jgi:gliding motility-associated-like protein/uncharacterized repeat protein (TIGR01451 family)